MNATLHKLIFCSRLTAGFDSFSRLVLNSKKLRWSKSDDRSPGIEKEPEAYQFKIGSEQRTVWLRTYDGDIDILYEVFWKKIYELPSRVIEDARLIIDLGANIGLSALYFLSKNPRVRLICVEPDPANLGVLSRNLVKELATNQARILAAAVMETDGLVALDSGEMKYNSRVVESEEKNTRSISMQGILDMYHIDRVHLLKIDIEGAEKYIFSGDTSWLEKIDNLVIELHSEEDHRIVLCALRHHHFHITALRADPANNNLFMASRPVIA